MGTENKGRAAVKSEDADTIYDAPTDDESGASAVKVETDDEAEDEPNGNLTICRFRIKHLKGEGLDPDDNMSGYAKCDYYIDLTNERHGLYDLMSEAHNILHRENLAGRSMNSSYWSVKFAGTTYHNGVRRFDHLTDKYNRPPKDTDIDDGEVRILSSLANPISKGQKGRFLGKAAVDFSFLMEDAALDVIGASGEKLSLFPKVTRIQVKHSGFAEQDWISNSVMERCANLRSAWKTLLQVDKYWRPDFSNGSFLKVSFGSFDYDVAELQVIGLLINSGIKFKKAWNTVLKFALLNRTEGAVSTKWYQLRGKDMFIDHVGKNMRTDDRITLAKRLAEKRMNHFLDMGHPNPYLLIEKSLRKRGMIDDSTSESEKKRLRVEWSSYSIMKDMEEDDDHPAYLLY